MSGSRSIRVSAKGLGKMTELLRINPIAAAHAPGDEDAVVTGLGFGPNVSMVEERVPRTGGIPSPLTLIETDPGVLKKT